jgi:SAM-dependent methyltransferase
MTSSTRKDCQFAVSKFANYLLQNNINVTNALYVGIAGDPPGGEYAPLFPNSKLTTFDLDKIWKPDIVGDITNTTFVSNTWDLIICVQVMEHISNLWELPTELLRITKPGGSIIIDCPWNYPYHAEPPSFGDYWRISKDGFRVLFKDFSIIDIISTEHNTSCLLRKND